MNNPKVSANIDVSPPTTAASFDNIVKASTTWLFCSLDTIFVYIFLVYVETWLYFNNNPNYTDWIGK
jgi:hypothetical protein